MSIGTVPAMIAEIDEKMSLIPEMELRSAKSFDSSGSNAT
jgi:hypothetical protein